MTTESRARGPWFHRLLVWLFTAALGVLVYWLAGFVLDDIGAWPGPDYDALEAAELDRRLLADEQALRQQAESVDRKISEETAQQQSLRDSTENSQRTMNQLLEFQRLNLQKDVKPSSEEQQSLADAERRFLANQRQYQEHNEELVKLNGQRRRLQAQQQELQDKLENLRRPIRQEHARLLERHALMLGFVKLGFLLPLLAVAAALFVRLRTGAYAPPAMALGAAVLAQVAQVMHEYFPARYFKYVVILAALAVVLRVLVQLLRMIARPKRDWLLQQYREAYEVFQCPICAYPVRRGPLRYRFWTRRSLKSLALPPATAEAAEEPYTCPACSTTLYEKCQQCGAVRASLLPTCQHCGHCEPLDSLPT